MSFLYAAFLNFFLLFVSFFSLCESQIFAYSSNYIIKNLIAVKTCTLMTTGLLFRFLVDLCWLSYVISTHVIYPLTSALNNTNFISFWHLYLLAIKFMEHILLFHLCNNFLTFWELVIALPRRDLHRFLICIKILIIINLIYFLLIWYVKEDSWPWTIANRAINLDLKLTWTAIKIWLILFVHTRIKYLIFVTVILSECIRFC